MSKVAQHTRIITQVAKQVLAPHGLVQQGKSRTWLDDHGWFTTLVEFQPFKDRQGSCINVGVNFHWNLSEDESFDVGYRESDFVDYESDEQFSAAMEKLALHALKKVNEYRQTFSDYNSAKQFILQHQFTSDELWGNFHRGMICGLTNDPEGLHKYLNIVLADEDDYDYILSLKEQALDLKTLVNDQEAFHAKVNAVVKESRRLKKLPGT